VDSPIEKNVRAAMSGVEREGSGGNSEKVGVEDWE